MNYKINDIDITDLELKNFKFRTDNIFDKRDNKSINNSSEITVEVEGTSTEEFLKILGVDIATRPDVITIQLQKLVQVRKHKKKRINKKWAKKYGYKTSIITHDGWYSVDKDDKTQFVCPVND